MPVHPKGVGIVVAIMAVLAHTTAAFAEKPQLFEDAETIFERVLTKPEQSLFDQPDGAETQKLWPLQPVYVFERKTDWLRVGRSPDESEGWILETDTVPWVHNIVGAFTARGKSRERQIVFGTLDEMQTMIDHEAYFDLAAKYRTAAIKGESTTESGVISVEPETFADISEQDSFYLMPITNFKERRIGPRRSPTLYLELAAVPLDQVVKSANAKPDFRSGIVFVVDTTSSMQPFITETLAAVRDAVTALRDKGRDKAAAFGLVGFRDNPEGRPGTDYRVREFLPLRPDNPPNAILDALSGMDAMRSGSTWGFEEDSLAGVSYALEKTEWSREGDFDFAGRFVILITDAPPKPPKDENAEAERSPTQVFKLAGEKKVAVSTVHIISKSGRGYNAIAEEAYTELSRFRNLPDEMYYPVDATQPDVFRDKLSAVIARLITDITQEEGLIKVKEDEQVDSSNVGLAMRLAYLGRQTGQDVAPILRGWTLEHSFEELREFAIEPRVLITRNQLLSMTEIMSEIQEKSRETARKGQGNLLFEDIRNVVVGIGADSDRLVNEGADSLGGMIAEFLEYMPYYSKRRLMQVTKKEWNNDPGLRLNIAYELEVKLELYESLYKSEELWTRLYPDQPDGERVYAMPLEALP